VAILPGKRLGPYEILSAVGAGGMGEVYRAKDTRLDRIVAIKVLPDHLSSKPDLRERFEREAKTIASLNHPHICTLHDVGHQDGTDFLVMEYVEGETLAQRLTKGALPLEQVLQYSIEIADALDKAHRKGITHRDLKPGNIMLTKSGAKLLDFGLAKAQRRRFLFPSFPRPTIRSRRKEPSSGLCSTWHRNKWKAEKWIRGPIFLRSVWWCTRWRRGRKRSRARAKRA
jgi:serine/threonine protein kinase